MEKFAFSLMEIDVSLLFISCFSEYPVFSRITIQLKVLLSQQICGIIAAKQLLYPSYGQKEGRTMIGIIFDFNGTMFYDERFQQESTKTFIKKKKWRSYKEEKKKIHTIYSHKSSTSKNNKGKTLIQRGKLNEKQESNLSTNLKK